VKSLESWAVITLEESRDDRFVREYLAREGIGGLISESSQEVPIDDFGVIKMVPLDSFRDQIEEFDPRDDGYAAKLKAFFVRDGKRFFFLPLNDGWGNRAAKLQRQLNSLLGDMPFSFSVLGQPKPVFGYFLLLAAACVFVLGFSGSRQLFIFQVPVLLAFGWSESSAFVLAALLSGTWELLREPLSELTAARRYDRMAFDYAGTGFKGLKERLKPFRLNCKLAVLFMVIFVVICIVKGLAPVPVIAGCFCFFSIFYMTFRAKASKTIQSRHILFTPVPLFPFKMRTFSLFPMLVPFAAGIFLVLFLPRIFPDWNRGPSFRRFLDSDQYELQQRFPGYSRFRYSEPVLDSRYFISADDYHKHLAFQRSFSYRPLDQQHYLSVRGANSGIEALNKDGYLRYYLGDDGLIAGSTVIAGSADNTFESGIVESSAEPESGVYMEGGELLRETYALFQLEKLMEFLVNYNEPRLPEARITDYPLFGSKEWISVFIILAACMSDLFRSRIQPRLRCIKKKKVSVYGEKRIAPWNPGRLERSEFRESERRLPS